jgi:maleate isomerase
MRRRDGVCVLGRHHEHGPGYHRHSQERLHRRTIENGAPAPVVTSAGALMDGLKVMGARKIAMITPYLKPLIDVVVNYINVEEFNVIDSVSLEIDDNVAVGRRDPMALVDIAKDLDLSRADALVLSACVQMPSLAAIPAVEEAVGKPVISAAVCTAYRMPLGLEAIAPNAGALLDGAYNFRPVFSSAL